MKIDIWFPDNSSQSCGGSLLDPGRVLTAGHCLFSGGEKFVVARLILGAHNVQDLTSGDELFIGVPPEDVIIHPNYHSPLKSNDIAMVFILHPEDQADIKNHPKIHPVCLPSPSSHQDLDGKSAVAVGWGQTSLHGPPSTVLLEVDLTIVSLEECQRSYSATRYSDSIDEKVICAGLGDRKGDTCKGWKIRCKFYVAQIKTVMMAGL